VTQPLVSGSWFRVAPLKPSLVGSLKIVRQRVRNQLWHVLVEPGSGRQLRLNPTAYAFVGGCDGRASVESLWQGLLRQKGEDAPSQDEVLRLLAQLFHAGMLHFDATPHLSLLFERRSDGEERRRRAFINPLTLRVRLFDPSRLLDRLAPLGAGLTSILALVLWAFAVLLAAGAAAVAFPQLKADALRVAAMPSSFAIAWVAYPLIKSLHELGHALAVRRFGGVVHEVGISLLLLTPAPYVDASAANAFERVHQRALVSAAGIMVELALAALAMFAWALLVPGLLRDTAMVILLICSISTLIFNGNPLLRLDGYHLLCDLLQLPNLALRSQAWWASAWRRWIAADQPLPSSTLATGETKWLVLYAPASWAYRLVLLFALVLWVGHHSWLFGWLAALGLLAWLGTLAVGALLRSAAAALVLTVSLFVIPAPASVVARGVVWPPERAQLRVEAGGFVEMRVVGDGAPVAEGEVVLKMADPDLTAQHDKTASERDGLLAQQYQALLQDPARAGDLNQQIERNAAELQHAEDQLARLEVRARSAGRVAWPREMDMAGTYAQRGAMLGYVLSPEPTQVRLVLRDEDLLLVRGRVQWVEVRLAEAPWTPHSAHLSNETPSATRQLPSAALGDRHGGSVPVDPADKDGVRTQAAVFLMDVVVPGMAANHVGGRAWVKLVLPSEPLGWQALRTARQLLLRQFSPTGQA
jgi:putative peptide zinc metalloprotease protein